MAISTSDCAARPRPRAIFMDSLPGTAGPPGPMRLLQITQTVRVRSFKSRHGSLQVPLRLCEAPSQPDEGENERAFANKGSVLRLFRRADNVPPATCQKAS